MKIAAAVVVAVAVAAVVVTVAAAVAMVLYVRNSFCGVGHLQAVPRLDVVIFRIQKITHLV